MGVLSKIFGESKEQKALREAVTLVRKIVEDEDFQVRMLPDLIQDLIKDGVSCDSVPGASGQFGFSETNPIPVNGAIGELAYLSKLETLSGERLFFHRIGAINSIDVFEAVTFTGSAWFVFFVDLYHPRRSRLTPDGFRFSTKLGQFTGFHNYCPNFPLDWRSVRASIPPEGIGIAYTALSRVLPALESGTFNRPVAHQLKLELLRSKLTSLQTATRTP
jgi:hypothetical protein